MKIRIEKVEVEVPREFVDTIAGGLLRLKTVMAEAAERKNAVQENRLYTLLTGAVSLLQQFMANVKPAAEQTPTEGEGQEEAPEPPEDD